MSRNATEIDPKCSLTGLGSVTTNETPKPHAVDADCEAKWSKMISVIQKHPAMLHYMSSNYWEVVARTLKTSSK